MIYDNFLKLFLVKPIVGKLLDIFATSVFNKYSNNGITCYVCAICIATSKFSS